MCSFCMYDLLFFFMICLIEFIMFACIFSHFCSFDIRFMFYFSPSSSSYFVPPFNLFACSSVISVIAAQGADESGSNFDLRTLRAVRVLRPLKLVSGIPSEYNPILKVCTPTANLTLPNPLLLLICICPQFNAIDNSCNSRH